jgi:hypothetical protein
VLRKREGKEADVRRREEGDREEGDLQAQEVLRVVPRPQPSLDSLEFRPMTQQRRGQSPRRCPYL